MAKTKPNPIDIDPHRLDREWVGQARLYLEHAEALAEAGKNHDVAKSRFDVVKAELETAIRANPTKFGLDKVTEKSVLCTIPLQGEYEEAQQVVIEAKYEKDVIGAMVSAMDHRKKALEKLVELHLSGYYAEPRGPKSSEEAQEAVSEINKKAARRPLRKKRGKD